MRKRGLERGQQVQELGPDEVVQGRRNRKQVYRQWKASGMGCGGVIKTDFRNSRAAKWGHKRLLEGGGRDGQGLCGGRTEQEERGEEESPSDSE